jgi:hypothetical protein
MTTKEIFSEMQKRMDTNPVATGIKAVFFDISGADPEPTCGHVDGRPRS